MNINFFSNGRQKVFPIEKTGMIIISGINRAEFQNKKLFGDVAFFSGTTSNPICQSAIVIAERNGRGTISNPRSLVEVDLFDFDINLIRNGKGQVVSITFGENFAKTLNFFGKRIDFQIFPDKKAVNEFVWNHSSAFRKLLKG